MAHIVVDFPGDTCAFTEYCHTNGLGAFLIDIGNAQTIRTSGLSSHILRSQQRAPRHIRRDSGPSQDESEQCNQRHRQRLEVVGATSEPKRE